jgi:hypothetical protein
MGSAALLSTLLSTLLRIPFAFVRVHRAWMLSSAVDEGIVRVGLGLRKCFLVLLLHTNCSLLGTARWTATGVAAP